PPSGRSPPPTPPLRAPFPASPARQPLVPRRARSPPLERPPPGEGPGQRELVGVFQLPTDRQPVGEPRGFDLKRCQLLGQVGGRRLPFHVRIGGQDHLRDRLPPPPRDQLSNLQLSGAAPVD